MIFQIIFLLTRIFIDDTSITYVDSVTSATARVVSRDFQGKIERDIDGDSINDIFYYLSQDFGGSGTFYYVYFFISSKSDNNSGIILIGDRVMPKTLEILNDELVISFLDRDDNEPFSVTPHLLKKLKFNLFKL